jgi:hypothetical protein
MWGFSDLYSITGYTFYHITLIRLYIGLFSFPFYFRLFYSNLLFLCSAASMFFISLSYSYLSCIFSCSKFFILFPVRFIIPRIYFLLLYLSRPRFLHISQVPVPFALLLNPLHPSAFLPSVGTHITFTELLVFTLTLFDIGKFYKRNLCGHFKFYSDLIIPLPS